MSTSLAKSSDGSAETVSISRNPATGQEIARYAHDTSAERDQILESAHKAWFFWRNTPVSERANVLRRIRAELLNRREALAITITQEMGKPVSAARAEVDKCAELCNWYADHAASLARPEPAEVGSDGQAHVAFLPLGVVLGVMPWNFPLWQVLRAAVPILTAGNAFLVKHADNVQGSANNLASIMQDVGLPSGLFGVVNTDPRGIAELIADPRIAAVTVTAGVNAGAAIAREAGRNLKKTVLELGGSDPFVVLADADLDRAVPAAVEARFANAGQVCIAAKRIIVEKSIHAEFVDRFAAEVAALRLGDPMAEATDLGPMAIPRLRDELHRQVEESVSRGASLLAGGAIPDGPGNFYPATILTNVTADMPVFDEETFGPVAAIVVADDESHAIQLANNSNYGLSSALWTSNLQKAATLASQIETGAVFINGISKSDPRVPIGGIKNSGYGRELSHFGFREFCNAQLVWTRD